MSMTDFEEYDWAAGPPYLSVGAWQGENRDYREHTYRHPRGVVEVYQQIGVYPLVNMRFRHKGRDHVRTWRAHWGDKTIARLARELVEDIT